ncbi:zinc finger protein Xfin-like isoform X2 [Hydractinia symbiolongicarpus]|uniref:zinc finger protein Xfin-like isoform X2 n=1 Tax=Hydractinia symbiolongicarpus TaxID=13093 RepID=UPI00254FE84C|nr:zinc finger protein Xfin-like isoform X2 [Hydractinia symbiolongicarpus]
MSLIDDICFYKIEWLPTWVPSTELKDVQHLVDSFWAKKNEEKESSKSDEDKMFAACFFCEQEVSADNLCHHEKEHVGKSTFDDIAESLTTTSGCLAEGILMFSSKNNKNDLSTDKIQTHCSPCDKNTCPNVSVDDVPNSPFSIPSSSDELPDFLCPKCNKCFRSFNEFRQHYQWHRTAATDARFFECGTCQRKFVSKDLFDKHNQLHVASNRRQKSYGKKITSTKKRRPLLSKGPGPVPPPSIAVSEVIDTLRNNESDIESLLPVKKRGRKKKEQSGEKKKRGRPDDDFTPDVLRSARQYIKSVSKRRKEIKMMRLSAETNKTSTVGILDGIGVDVALKKSEDALPIMSCINGRQAYACKVCGKVFFNKFHHREHYNVHSGEMPYECEFCGKRFAQRSGWNRHIKLHHKYEVFSGPIPRKFEMTAAKPADLPGSNTLESAINNIVFHRNETTPVPTTSSHFLQQTDTSTPSTALSITTYVQGAVRTSNVPTHTTTAIYNADALSDEGKQKQLIFQCKKVRTPSKGLIFMIRYAYSMKQNYYNSDFVYVLDSSGHVSSRINASEYPVGEWLDFPLDETANDVLLERIRDFDAFNNCRKRLKGTFCADSQEVQESSTHLQSPSKASDVANLPFTSSLTEPTTATVQPVIASKQKETPAVEAQPVMAFQTETPVVVMAQPVIVQDLQNGNPTIHKVTHGRSFRSGRDKRFQCTVCGRKFLAQAHLNDHMLIHTGELPFKCMFCARPFRHKSALNCHHKRHVEKGIYNRPISGAKRASKKASWLTEHTEETQSEKVGLSNKLTAKPKRKGRKPKQLRKTSENAFSINDSYPVRIKAEEGIDISENATTPDLSQGADSYGFECNFCSLRFPMRTAYLKHVNAVHKASRLSATSLLLNGENDSFSQRVIDNSLADLDVRMDDLGNNGMDYLFPDIKIKEEVIEDF